MRRAIQVSRTPHYFLSSYNGKLVYSKTICYLEDNEFGKTARLAGKAGIAIKFITEGTR